jgi:hypothetical protein
MSDFPDSEKTAGKERSTKVSFAVPADLVLYAALVGKTPEIAPELADPLMAATLARRDNPWSPMVLSIYLRQVCRQQALKINKPELAAWIKKQSRIARRRFNETQARVINAAKERAA